MGGIFDLFKVKIYKNKIIASKIQSDLVSEKNNLLHWKKIVSDSGFFRNL